MKHFLTAIAALLCVTGFFSSCSSTETYAEQVQKEKDAIQRFLKLKGIIVISNDQFVAQGYETPGLQYVLFNTSGVYMHIENKGTDGAPLAQGKSAVILSRYRETNINTLTDISYDNTMGLSGYVENYTVRNYYGTFTGTFESGVMYNTYGSSVPGAWLVPLKYVNLGRGANKYVKDANGNYLDKDGNITTNPDEYVPGQNAHVQIIAPHDMGTSTATSSVYATYYDLTYELADN